MRAPTKWEAAVLDVILKELRRAVRDKKPIEIMIDPFVMGGGAYVNASRCEPGHTYTIEGRAC